MFHKNYDFSNISASEVVGIDLTFSVPVEIIYVDGIKPDAPNFPYDWSDSNNKTKFTFSKFTKNTGDVLKMRVDAEQEPEVTSAIWQQIHLRGPFEIPRKWLIEKVYAKLKPGEVP